MENNKLNLEPLDLEPINNTKLNLEPLDLEPISSKDEISQTEATARGALQGVTLGFGEELLGGAKAIGKTVFGPDELANFLETYRRERDIERSQMKAAEEAYPVSFTGAEIAGGIAPAFLTGGASVPASIGRVGIKQAFKAGIKPGLKYGATSGLGYGEADITKGEIPQAIAETGIGAGTGAVVGGTLGVVGEKAVKPGMEKLGQLKEWFKDQSPTLLRNMISATQYSKEGTPMVGYVTGENYMNQLKNKTYEMVEELNKARKTGRDEFEKILNSDDVAKSKEDMFNFFQSEKDNLNNILNKTIDEDEKKGITKIINQVDQLQNKFKTKETLELPDTTSKDKAILALENKRNLMLLSDEQKEGTRKEINRLLDQYMIKDGVTEPAAIDVYKISRLLKLPQEEVRPLIRDAVKIKYSQKMDIPEVGEVNLPVEKKGIVKSFEPGEIQIDDTKGIAYFFDKQGRMHSKSYGEIPVKSEIIEKQQPMLVNAKELYEFNETLKKIGNTNNEDLIKHEVGNLTKKVGDKLTNLLKENNQLEAFNKMNELYSSTYGIAKTLGKEDILSKLPQEKNVAINDLVKFFENVSKDDKIGQETRVVYNDFLNQLEKISGKEAKDKIDTEIKKLSKLIELNRAAASSSLQMKEIGLLAGGVQSLGIRGAIGVGKVLKGVENSGELIKKITGVVPSKLAEMSQKTKNPKLSQLFKNLSEVESEQTKKALMFSAMQNPNTRDALLEEFGIKSEKKEE